MRSTLLALCFVIAAFAFSGCSGRPLDDERFQALLSPSEVSDALGNEVSQAQILDTGQLVAQEAGEVNAFALEHRYAMEFAGPEGRTLTLDIWQFRTDIHARDRLDALVRRGGLSATDELVGGRSAEALGYDSASGIASWAVIGFERGRAVVVLRVAAPSGAEAFQGALRDLAKLVEGRL